MGKGVANTGRRRAATYPVVMARTHLTLAALATAAVEGLDVVQSSQFSADGAGDFESCLLTGRDGRHWIIRVPRTERAEAEQSADLVALRALSAGIRARLPFAVSTFVGQAPFHGTRAVVYEFVYGEKAQLDRMDVGLAAAIGSAIGAIHALPTSFVADAGLPVRAAVESVSQAVGVVDRAKSTGLVPVALQARWMRAIEDPTLWQFSPTVVNGTLTADSFLAASGGITGVLGWSGLRVDDPAVDLHWLLGAPAEVADAAFDAYQSARGTTDRRLRDRARLLAELELARWLLHGVQTRDTGIVDDAVQLMSGLVEDLADQPRPVREQTGEPLSVDEVEELLGRTAQVR